MATQTQTAPTMETFTQSRIPLVTHVINDEDLGLLQGTKLIPVNLNKMVKLLTDPHSAMLYDRHVHALKRVIRHYSKGFPLKDLVQVFKILNVCADRVEDQPMYEDSLCDILKLCCLPFLQEKSSDQLAFRQILQESVSQLGYLMRVPSSAVRLEICKTLNSFYCVKQQQQQVQNYKGTNLDYNRRIVEDSDIAETLVKSLALLENDTDVKIQVLNVLQNFSKDSEKNCNEMLNGGAAQRICSRLMDTSDPSGQLLFRSVDVLWNLLTHGDRDTVAQQLNNLDCISQLRDAYIFQLTQGYSHYDRQLRNDLLVIASLVASLCPQAPFIETGFAKQLVLFATFQEVKSNHVLVKHLKLSQTHEDFELKKLLFNLLAMLSQDPAVLPILAEGHLMLALFSYVRGNDVQTGPREWTPAQFEELQLESLSCLSSLCPLMLEDYMTCQGSTRILLLLEWCVSPDEFGGHGNSFHGSGGRGNKRAQMRHCVRLLRSVVSTGDERVLQDLVDQGAINQISGILTNATSSEDEDDAIDVEMQSDMLFILSSLCDGDMHRKELFGTEGVNVCVAYLRTDPRLVSGGLGHHRLLLATVDCIWCAVVGCYITEDYLLEKEGVFLLIDLLQYCPKNMHNLIVGCLLDMCENPKTVHHVLTWRGKKNMSAAHLFCQMWREEEQEMGVKREPTGAIADLNQPLRTSLQEELGVTPLSAHCPSQAIVDVSENMRAKLYSLFCKLGFTDLPGLDVTDHVTLTIIEKYMEFKMGEVLTEVIDELEVENVRPVTPDREALEAISRAVEDRAQIVASTQEELLQAQSNQDIIEEQEFYAEIRENHRQKEKALNDFTEFVARTSNYTVLKAAKERQELSVEASRIQPKFRDTEAFHSTDIQNLQTTAFSGRHVKVDSTPPHLTGGPLAKFDHSTGTLHKRRVITLPAEAV
ncbi:cilia- and flagella-associated protein 69-like [Liolophura sinensis]|uniref:cilia- and flagella-associated protein 69-like n=1 Tax=Liolophura sinensis TaxID=3198878 RepID=UPI003158F902